MANLLLFGATGGTGRLFLDLALADGHKVTAFVLPAEAGALPSRPNLTLIQGNLELDSDDRLVQRSLQGHDVVVFTAGTSNIGTLFKAQHWGKPYTLYSRTAQNIVQGITTHGNNTVKRVVALTSCGVDPDRANELFLFRNIVRPLFLRRYLEDVKVMETTLVTGLGSAKVEWVIVRVPGLNDSKARGAGGPGGYTIQDRILPIGAVGMLSRGDLARFLVSQVALDNKEWVERFPTLANTSFS